MGNLLGIAAELVVLIGAIVIILYFGGYRAPKAGDEESLAKFYALKEKHGKKIVTLGVVLLIITLFRILTFFI